MSNNISYVRPEVEKAQKEWTRISDVRQGERTLKRTDLKKKGMYLPPPNPQDESTENGLRYEQYVNRAVFYPATERTLTGLIGIALGKKPQVTVGGMLEGLERDTDGAGGSIYNQVHRSLEEVLATGRGGLLTDFPKAGGAISQAEHNEGKIHPVITFYDAASITNWHVEDGALRLVVLAESVQVRDGYEVSSVNQWRELTLNHPDHPGEYVQQLWREGESSAEPVPYGEPMVPTDAAGNTWALIPFQFIGAVDNDESIDKSPLQDLAELNLAHYRCSADYFESVYFTGQGTFAASGLTQSWVDTNFSDGRFYLGCRSIIPLPEGGGLTLVQANPNTLSGEAMDKTEKQMIALGARLMMPGQVAKTADQNRSETAAAHSVLSLACDNVSSAYTQALLWAEVFAGSAEENTGLRINTDFTGIQLNPQLLQVLVGSWQSGAFPQSDLFTLLRLLGVVDPEKTDEELREELDGEGGGLNLDMSDDGDTDPETE